MARYQWQSRRVQFARDRLARVFRNILAINSRQSCQRKPALSEVQELAPERIAWMWPSSHLESAAVVERSQPGALICLTSTQDAIAPGEADDCVKKSAKWATI